jgi:hypothetical protein
MYFWGCEVTDEKALLIYLVGLFIGLILIGVFTKELAKDEMGHFGSLLAVMFWPFFLLGGIGGGLGYLIICLGVFIGDKIRQAINHKG